ncbi:hypothetical protein BH11ARM2_BH11ARM2_12700 [soil metagenome]
MVSEVSPEASFEAAKELLLHLRHHPSDAGDPKALAERFNLPEAMVAAVVAGARRPEPTVPPKLTRKISMEAPRRAAKWAKGRVIGFTDNPATFIFLTSAITMLIILMIQHKEGPKAAKVLGPMTSNDLGAVIVLLITAIGQFSLFYRKGKARHPLIGAAMMWLAAMMVMAGSAIFAPEKDQGWLERAALLGLEGTGLGIFGLLYAGVGTVVSLLGAYSHTQKLDRRTDEMNRADLLDRYFELQKRLEKGSTRQRVAEWLDTSLPARIFRRGVWIVSLAAQFAFTSISLLIHVVRDLTAIQNGTLSAIGWALLVLQVGVVAGYLVMWILVGLFAGSIPRSILLMTAMALLGYGLHFLPIPPYGMANAFSPVTIISVLSMMLISWVVAGFSALAADVQRFNARDRRLADNDPTVLMGEMLRIQWKLAEATSNVCVMVVDAAKSAQMKAEADPLTAEYSFREYQVWLARIAKQFGGKVTATVGDGAIFEFTDCESALKASKRVHTDLDRFNREENRLTTPFRLRIGLHIGEVVGAINEVQFTEVIDIAAHVQGAAPIGGVAVTGPVAACLTGERFIPLADPIDNHQVLIAAESVEV